MADDREAYKKDESNTAGVASAYSIPTPKTKPMTPFDVPGQNKSGFDKKAYSSDKVLALKEVENDFRNCYAASISGRLTGILGNGSEDDAKPINEALLGFARDKNLDTTDIYKLAQMTRVGRWGPLSKTIQDKLGEKFDLNAPGSGELEKGIYLSPKKPKDQKN